jgi:hypothetical protein
MDANPEDDRRRPLRAKGLGHDVTQGWSARDLIHHIGRRLDAARDQRAADSLAGRLRAPRSQRPNSRPASEREQTSDGEFDQLARDLHQLLRETDERLDRLGHDARVVLTVINGRAQLLRRQALATGAPDLRVIRSMAEIERAVARLHGLLNDHLAPPTGRMRTETDPGNGRADEP